MKYLDLQVNGAYGIDFNDESLSNESTDRPLSDAMRIVTIGTC